MFFRLFLDHIVALETPMMRLRLRLSRRAAFVGVTSYMDASVCVAFFAIHGALPAGGACDFCATRVRLPAHTHGVNHTDVDAERLDAATLALVRDLTRVDELLFAEALSSFVARARRVENATGVALLCDLDIDDPPASGASRIPPTRYAT